MAIGITRRNFMTAGAFAIGAAMLPWTVQAQNRMHWVFIGAYNNASGENLPTDFGTRAPDAISRGISSFSFDGVSGKTGPVQLAAEIPGPKNLTMHSNKKFLYAGRNGLIEGQSPITAFAIQEDGTLRELNTVPSDGSGPSVGMVDSSGQNLLITNWSSSSVVCIRLNKDGTLGQRTALIGRAPGARNTVGPGALGAPATEEMLAEGHTKPHCIVLSQSERYAIAAEINSNRCHVMRFNAETGSLETHSYADSCEHCGPRHLMFHPSYRWLYTSGEEGSYISAWKWDEEKGALEHFQSLTTLPEGFDGPENHPADVRVHPSGRFVYVSNRTTGTIAGYRIDQKDGSLSPIDQIPIGSPSSWSLIFDPTGKWAIVTAQIGDAVRIYEVDNNTGQFLYTGQELNVVLPVCVRMA